MRIVFTVTEHNEKGWLRVFTRSPLADRADMEMAVRKPQLFGEMERLAVKYNNRPEAIAVLFEID